MAEYSNPWHKPDHAGYGPARYVSNGGVTHYRGYEIHHRLPDVWDVVKDGECKSQRAGINGAKRWVDNALFIEEQSVR